MWILRIPVNNLGVLGEEKEAFILLIGNLKITSHEKWLLRVDTMAEQRRSCDECSEYYFNVDSLEHRLRGHRIQRKG